MYNSIAIVRKHIAYGGVDDPARAPQHVRAALHQHERHIHVQRTYTVDNATAGAWLNVRADVVERMGSMAKRRAAEREVSDYIRDKVLPEHWDTKLADLADAMRECRQSGVYGVYHPDNRAVFAWDVKCGCSKLCPHEAREETKRLSAHYLPLLMNQIDQGNRVYYGVLTMPNVPRGELDKTQREIFRLWNALCKKTTRVGNGRRVKLFPEILGSLANVEAPQAADGSWNVHLNVILVTTNAGVKYEKLKHHWPWWFKFFSMSQMRQKTEERLRGRGQDVSRLSTRDVLQHALLEVIKYPVQTVAEKSDKGRRGTWKDDLLGSVYYDHRGRRRAPPLVEWAPEAFAEWWQAQKRFRRTRSYGKGVLFGFTVDKPPNTDMEQVTWLGEVRHLPDGTQRVGFPLLSLITGDNSLPSDTLKAGDRPPPDGSPEAHAYWLGVVRLSDYLKSQQRGEL